MNRQQATSHDSPLWTTDYGDGPLVATAIHDGGALRHEVFGTLALDETTRFREEDPHTGVLTQIAPTRVVVHRSRFEVDLNRPREQAVYRVPDDAWGLDVWRETPDEALVARSLVAYDLFYAHLHALLTQLLRYYPRLVVLDFHSYNYLRDGAEQQPADPEQNPEINIGTGSLDRERWAPVVERAMTVLRRADFCGRQLDVRENVRFRGGHLSRWIHQQFPTSVGCLAIECKKIFMDEWTGAVDDVRLQALRRAFDAAGREITEELHGPAPGRA